MPFQRMSATPARLIHGAGQHEQEVAEPVQVNDDRLRDVLARGPGERHGQPFGAAAESARQVDLHAGRRSPGRMNCVSGSSSASSPSIAVSRPATWLVVIAR